MKAHGYRTFSGLRWTAVALVAAAAWVSGCEIDSGDVSRSVDIRIGGRYTGPEGGRLVSGNSGAAIHRLDLQQNGHRLQGVDNNGTLYQGKIGRVGENTATLRLDGTTTAGAAFTLTGTVTVSGSTATLHGTWVEADRRGGVHGQAAVTPKPDPDPDPENGDPVFVP